MQKLKVEETMYIQNTNYRRKAIEGNVPYFLYYSENLQPDADV